MTPSAWDSPELSCTVVGMAATCTTLRYRSSPRVLRQLATDLRRFISESVVSRIADCIMIEPPSLPQLSDCDDRLSLSAVPFPARYEILTRAEKVWMNGVIALSPEMGVGQLLYLVNSDGLDCIAVTLPDGSLMRVGAKMNEVMGFFRVLREMCEGENASARQTLKFLIKVWNVSLSKIIEANFCSLTVACARVQQQGLELPAPDVEDSRRSGKAPIVPSGSSRGAGPSSRGSVKSGNYRIPKKAPRTYKVESEESGSDSDAPPRRKKSKSKASPKAKDKKSKDKKSKKKVKTDEPEEYDPDWGGNKNSTLACWGEVNKGPGGCTKENCDYSHRPSIVEAARRKAGKKPVTVKPVSESESESESD